jgi:hypothetical protein
MANKVLFTTIDPDNLDSEVDDIIDALFGEEDGDTEGEVEKGFEVKKFSEDKQIVFGWASVTDLDGNPVVDLQGDILESDVLEKAAYDYVLNSREAGDMHRVHRGIGKVVESVVLTKEKASAMGLELPGGKVGWWIGMHIDNPDVWAKVKSGEYTAFSIGGSGVRVPLED